MLVVIVVLSGCADNTSKPTPTSQNSGSQQTTPTKPVDITKPVDSQPTHPSEDTQPNEETEPENPINTDEMPSEPTEPEPTEPEKPAFNQEDCLDKIPFSVDMPACWEFRDVDVNGEFRRISVQFELDSSDLSLSEPFCYYYIDIHGDGSTDMRSKVVAVGRFLLGEYATEILKENIGNDEFLGMEDFFWTDFNASTFKGQDQEYIVFKIPASWEFNTASMIVTAPDATLLAEIVVDKTNQVKLQGDDVDRYQDSDGNTNFFSFSNDSITYLKVSQKVDGVTYLTEYSLQINDNNVTSVETGKTYQTTDNVPDLAGPTIY